MSKHDPAERVAIVPAASQGIGLAVATELSRAGCAVGFCSRNEDRIAQAADAISAQTGGTVMATAVDITDAYDQQRWMRKVQDVLGTPQIIILNSGGPPPATFMESTESEYLAALELVFFSAIRLIRLVLPGMREAGWGRIVSISSFSARSPLAELAPSVASRGALLGVLKLLSREVGTSGITVNSILTGPVATERIVELAQAEGNGTSIERELKALGNAGVLGRLGAPEEIAAVVAFLCTDQAAYMTGAAIPVDGGAIATL
jgi:3-oxoacyl-[acyl-carrier protein] reductase